MLNSGPIPGLSLFAALTLCPMLAGGATNVPEGFEIQELRPTGGKMLKPKGWSYAERHDGPKYTWIVSRKPLGEDPVLTGLRIQLLAGIKEGTGKAPEEFCRNFLKACKEKGRDPTVIPDSKAGMFQSAGIEMLESIEVEGVVHENHVVYLAFWSTESDLVAMMSVGCPAEEWATLSPTLQRMASMQLIDRERFIKDGKVVGLARQKSAAPSGDQVVVAIKQLLADPLAPSASTNVDLINRFAELSPDVQVGVNMEFFPWVKVNPEAEEGRLLFGAYIGGNISPQIEQKLKKDHPLEGLQAVLGVYGKLCDKERFFAVEKYDEWLKLDAKGLEAEVKSILKASRELKR